MYTTWINKFNRETYFAAKNVAKSGKRVKNCFVIDRLVQIFDEYVSNTGTSQRRITLAPHDANWTAEQWIKIHGV